MESVQNFFKNYWEKFRGWVEANPKRAAITGGAIVLFLLSFVIPVDPPHVALSGEPIFSTGPDWLTNSIVTTIAVDIIIILLALLATIGMKEIPSGWQNFVEMVIEYLYNLSESVAGQNTRKFFPWVATIFIFVIISNWSGLLPGAASIGFYHEDSHAVEEGESEEHAISQGRRLAMADGNLLLFGSNDSAQNIPVQEEEGEGEAGAAAEEEEHHATFVPLIRAPSSDLNMTFALAIVTIVLVQIWGVQALGGSYFDKFINFRGSNGFMKGINGFVGILEILSEFSRIVAFGFRLFGNIFAGEIVLATMAFLIAFLFPIPFYILEIFIGFVQALVFMMLALVFFSMAVISHGHGDDHAHEAGH